MKKSVVDDYRQCVEACKNIDYGDTRSVRANNRAVTKMYSLIRKAAKEGDEGLEPFFELLNEPVTSEWLSFQLLEVIESPPPEIESRCLEIIRNIAKDDNRQAISFGSQIWLEKWEQKKGSRE